LHEDESLVRRARDHHNHGRRNPHFRQHSKTHSNPIWSRDGRTIYYRDDTLGPPDIYRWTLGEDHGTLIYQGSGVEQPEDVSPDGKWMLFVSYNRPASSDVWLMPLNPPGPAKPLIATPFNEWFPRFSPDGKWIAYQSDVSGRAEVYLRAFEGSGLTMRISKDGGTRPRWRADCKELFFLASDGKFMSVAIHGGVPVGVPRTLFQSRNAVDFEPAADGARFLVQIEDQPLDPPVHLLINWPARLKSN